VHRNLLSSLIFVTTLYYSETATALPVSAGISIGKPLLFIDLDQDTRESLGAKVSIGTDVNLFVPDYPFAIGVFYETLMLSNYGTMPINNAGIQLSYYPLGKPITVQNQSGEINIKNLGMTLYGTLGSGLTFMNIRENSGEAFVFGAAAFNLRLSTTLEYPLSDFIAAGGTLLYQTNFGGTSPEEPYPTVGITGFSALTRLVFTIN